jgi:hypothetical protein
MIGLNLKSFLDCSVPKNKYLRLIECPIRVVAKKSKHFLV